MRRAPGECASVGHEKHCSTRRQDWKVTNSEFALCDIDYALQMPILLYMCRDCRGASDNFERQSSIGRRGFLAGSLLAFAATSLPIRALSAASSSPQYTLFIERMDT